MKIQPGSVLLAAIAIGVGTITLLGYFLSVPLLLALRLQFVSWAALLAAVAVWIGVFNLLRVHFKRIGRMSPGWFYSLFFLLSLFAVIGVGAAGGFLGWGSGPASSANVWIFRNVQSVVAAALSGLVAFFLVFAGYRALRRPPSLTSVVFIITALIALAGMLPLQFVADVGLRDLWLWLAQVPAVAGARGLLLGIGLGVVATGLRILLAVDRPYGE